mgnify:CR=1 FL=1
MFKKIFILLKKKIKFKKNIKYLIIGFDNSDLILRYIPTSKTEIVSFKIINFYIIIHLLLNNEKITKLNYFKKAIELANPSIVVTTIDTDTDFYRLKKFYPQKKFIAIQNGYRTFPKKTYLIKKNEKLSCDLIFCFGKQNINYYKSFIKAKIIVMGSIKNNLIPKDNIKKRQIITYISEFRSGEKNRKINYYNLGYVYWKDTLISELKLLKVINFLCKERNIKFYIMGRSLNNIKELQYYDDIIGKNNFTYIQRKNSFTSYNFVKNSQVIVSMTSTLGYEMLARDNRIIFFSKKFYKNKIRHLNLEFGWPSVKEKKGFFYSDKINNKEILRLAKNVIDSSEGNWIKKKKKYKENIMSYDFNNSLLKKELNKKV